MTIKTKTEGNSVTIAPEGRIDTITSPELEEAVAKIPADTAKIVFDFAEVEYISSAGLRVVLGAQKRMMAGGGKMTVANLKAAVREVFEITGLAGILDIA